MRQTRTLADVSGGRDNNFDCLRFLLAVFVLFYHCYPILYGLNATHHGRCNRVEAALPPSAWRGYHVVSPFPLACSFPMNGPFSCIGRGRTAGQGRRRGKRAR